MFKKTCKTVRDSIYGVLCQSPLGKDQINFGNGTAFMIAPNVCATASHVLHVDGDRSNPRHQKIEVIRATEVGSSMKPAKIIAEDLERDLALIEILNVTNETVLNLYDSVVESGTSCGALGFPMSEVSIINGQIAFSLVERFQGAYVSAFQKFALRKEVLLDFYEIDAVVYGGSSGCPAFTIDGRIFGMVIGTASEGDPNKNKARIAITRLVPSMDIKAFVKANGIKGLSTV